MSLILRADVDKPYGRKGLIRKIASKLVEDYIGEPWQASTIYLSHLALFLEYCNKSNIPGFICHRNCTRPNESITKLLQQGNHKVCFHAENTSSYEAFITELALFKNNTPDFNIESFTKHGSGKLKLGKKHYPPYEPEKYKEWALRAGMGYYFGNGTGVSLEELIPKNNFFENVFCIENECESLTSEKLKLLMDIAKNQNVVVLIHPCNFHASKKVASYFMLLVKLAKEKNIRWRIF
jgi:hypothetical protein